MDKEQKTPAPKKNKVSKKKKKKLKSYEILNKFFKKSSNDLKKACKKDIEERETEILTFALDLTGNINIIDKTLYNDIETLINLDGYKTLHRICKDLDKKIGIEVGRKVFGIPGVGSNTSHVPKIKIDLTSPYEASSFNQITIIEYAEDDTPTPYRRKKKKK